MISVQLLDGEAQGVLSRVIGLLENKKPVMSEIAGVMADASEDEFSAEGRPKWKALADLTVKARTKAGTWPGKIMQVSGGLASSISTRATDTEAAIGSNKVYAAIQQLGGKAGRGRKVTIPARGYLVFGRDETDEALDILSRHIGMVLRS